MTIVGISFSKIMAQKNKPITGKLQIQNNMNVLGIEAADMGKQKMAKISFAYSSVYEPGLGAINLEGDVLYTGTEAEVKALVSGWKKEKKIAPTVMAPIVNRILARSSVQALIVGRDVNLPPQMSLPKVQVKK
jgi:hypothetical protein